MFPQKGNDRLLVLQNLLLLFQFKSSHSLSKSGLHRGHRSTIPYFSVLVTLISHYSKLSYEHGLILHLLFLSSMQVIRQRYSVILTTHATSTITVVSLKEDYPQRPTTAGCHLKIIRVTLHVRCSGGLSWRDKDSRVRRQHKHPIVCLLYTSPSPRDRHRSRMPSSA